MPLDDLKDRVKPRHHMSTEELANRLSWSTTLGLMVVMALTLILPNMGAAAVNTVILVLLLPYLALQIWCTIVRKMGDLSGWAKDNVMALLALLLGFYIMTQGWFWSTHSADHHAIIMKCTVFDILDLAIGAIAALRIWGSTKDRDEIKPSS